MPSNDDTPLLSIFEDTTLDDKSSITDAKLGWHTHLVGVEVTDIFTSG